MEKGLGRKKEKREGERKGKKRKEKEREKEKEKATVSDNVVAARSPPRSATAAPAAYTCPACSCYHGC